MDAMRDEGKKKINFNPTEVKSQKSQCSQGFDPLPAGLVSDSVAL